MADDTIDKVYLNYRTESRVNYSVSGRAKSTDNKPMFDEHQLRTGALLRIADAQEKMAENFTTVMNQRDSYYKMWLDERAENKRLRKLLKNNGQ